MTDTPTFLRWKRRSRTLERDIEPKEGRLLFERGKDSGTARKALRDAQKNATHKEFTLRTAIGPSSTGTQHYEKSIKAIPHPEQEDGEDE